MDLWISLSVFSVLVSSVIHTSAGAAGGSELETFYTDNGRYCSKWLKFNGIDCSYECGSSLNGIIADSSSPIVLLHGCNYMTASANGNKTVVGASIYACSASFIPYTNCMNDVSCANFSSAHEASLCSPLNRYSQLCSQCKPSYAPPVYSYSMDCVKCNHSRYNWLKYIVVAFVPVTVFYLVIVTFQITVTSAPVNALVLSSQIITSSFYARQFFTTYVQYSERIDSAYFTQITFETIVSIWNLDFFRATYTPFCLTPSTNILHILSLDYIIAAYPLVLILLTYILVKLHNRGNAIVTYAWMPFNHCFFRLRRYFGVNTSLVNVFATFLLVSYIKFLAVSMDLLAPCLYPKAIPDIYHLDICAAAVLTILYLVSLLYTFRSFLKRQMLRVYNALTCCWLRTMQKLSSVVVEVEEDHSEYEELTTP